MKTISQNLAKSKNIVVMLFVLSSLTKLFGQCPTPISISVDTISSNCLGCCNGTATINVSGGCPPYQYIVSPSAFGGPVLNNLCSGVYTITVIDNNCCPTATTTFLLKQANTVGLVENSSSLSLTIFPNPSSGVYTISGIPIKAKIFVYDALGQIVYSKVSNKINESIDISELPTGIYLVMVKMNENEYNSKIMKN